MVGTNEHGEPAGAEFQDQLEILVRNVTRLERAVKTANWLPESFPKKEVITICGGLAICANGTQSGILPPLRYACDKLSDIRRRNFKPRNGEEAFADQPSLEREESLDQALALVIADLSTAISDYPADEVERGSASEFSERPASPGPSGTASLGRIASGADKIESDLKDVGKDFKDHERELRRQAEAEYLDLLRHLVDSRVSAAFLSLEARSRTVRPAWLDRLGRAISDIPTTLDKALGAFEHVVDVGKIFYKHWHDLKGRIFEEIFKAVKELIRELRRYLAGTSEPRRRDRTGFRDINELWCPEMVELPAGAFLMGSADGDKKAYIDEKKRHRVTIGYRLAVGRYPVTFEEYDRFVEAANGRKPDDHGWGRGRWPAIDVSWEDARAYCAWLSQMTGYRYRLLSEAEWEYACRAGTETAYSVGDQINPKDANFGQSVGKTTEVGAYPANPWGLHDMHGNVWEWVGDVWHENYTDAPDDGRAWTDAGDQNVRVLRGGSWDRLPRLVRAANRDGAAPDLRSDLIGFRVARTF